MNFYYRSLQEGRCEIVCTRCFRTVGAAGDIDEMRRLEDCHACAVRREAVPIPLPADSRHLIPATPRMISKPKAPPGPNYLLLSIAAVFLYIVPTLFEFTVLRNWNPWIAVVIPGDIAGCFCLAVVFRKVRIGIALYCVMTMIEAGLYWLNVMPPGILPWVTNLVPTLVVFGIIWRSVGRNAKLVAIS
jgi:hypothetical protein